MPRFLKVMILMVHGGGKLFSIPMMRENAPILAVCWTTNEEKQFRFFEQICGASFFEFCSVRRINFRFAIGVITKIPWRRIYRISCRIQKNNSFLVAGRMLETIFFYLGFLELLRYRKFRGVLVFSDVNPYALGAMMAARRRNLRTIYTNHGQLSGSQPSIFCDVNIFTSQSIKDLYRSGDAILRGWIGGSVGMRKIPLQSPKIGILLSLTVQEKGLFDVISFLTQTFWPSAIILREHPNHCFSHAYLQKKIEHTFPLAIFQKHESVEEFLQQVDLVIIGNSSAHIDALRSGVPSVFCDTIDKSPKDYYNFLEKGLTIELSQDLSISSINKFYGPEWVPIMRYFDSGYLLPLEEAHRRVASVLKDI